VSRRRPGVSSLSQHDDKTIEYCQKNNIVYEAYEAMRTCPFKNPKALAIAKSHNASVAQVCLRWIMQKGCIMAVGTGSNAKEVAAYAVRGATLVR
jgi:diketogulonate reductase-like aldo/keto reductase